MTLRQEGAASRLFLQKLLSYEADRVEVLNFSSVWLDQRVDWSKVVHIAVVVLPVGSKPPAAIVVRISKSERHDFGAASPYSTETASLHGRARGSAFTPKLVEVVFGPTWTLFAEKLSSCIACTALAAPSVRSRAFVSDDPSASMARRDCRTSCSWLA